MEENLSELTLLYEESYILDRTRAYHNLLQRRTGKRGSQAIQSYIWDFNVAYMEEGEKEFTYLQDELGSTIRLLEQGGECQAVYGYDEFGEDAYNTQGHLQPFGYTGYRYDNVADTYFAQAREYVPKIGRFVGEDWIKGNIEKPFSLNQYGYCCGNPIGLADRDGKTPEMASNYSQVFDILKTGTGMAGAAALADSPAPGPMDLVALGILGITLVVSGGVAVGTYINSTSKEKEKSRVIALEQVTTKRPNETVIYRRGNGNATNLTPRHIDLHTGLSYELKVPAATDYTITTMEAINATGVLTAVIDKPNHVSVRPVNPWEMMEDHVMSKLIDNLIKKYEYNIYINENISGEKLDKLALLLEKEENNTETYFNPLRYKSKFSWFNILYIIERMSYTRKLEYILFLIEFLQDVNWPVFRYTISSLMSYKKTDLVPFVEQALWTAYRDDDEMWIAGIARLMEKDNIKQQDFKNPETYDLLKYRDF